MFPVYDIVHGPVKTNVMAVSSSHLDAKAPLAYAPGLTNALGKTRDEHRRPRQDDGATPHDRERPLGERAAQDVPLTGMESTRAFPSVSARSVYPHQRTCGEPPGTDMATRQPQCLSRVSSPALAHH